MKLIKLSFVLLVLSAGCTTVHRGVVAMKIDEQRAHVCLGKTEAGVGDTLSVYRNECSTARPVGSKAATSSCTKKYLGEGVISEMLNEHYSVARFSDGVTFEEGDVIEVN